MSGVAAGEEAITALVSEALRQYGLTAQNEPLLEMPQGPPRKPDLAIENDGIYAYEAKWENDYFKGIAQARDYGLAHSIRGAIAIGYPEKLKQTKLSEFDDAESAIGNHSFRVAFLRENEPTEMDRVTGRDLPKWIDDHIHRREEPETDPDEVVNVLRQTANALTEGIEDIEAPDLFRNVLGIKPEESEQVSAGRHAAGFLLVNQITFYRVLSSVKAKYPDINPDELSRPDDFLEYFRTVLEDDYSAIFSFPVAAAYEQEHLELLRAAVKTIYGISPERIDHEVLGTVFHALTPLSVRKPVAAYYTKNKTAELLAELSIESGDISVLDPACGSGTLLTAAYRKKRALTDGFDEEDHRRFLENDITGIDIMPFAGHLSTIHLALEQPAYQTDKVRIGIEDATRLEPGKTISPVQHVLPESLTGQKSIDDFGGDMEWTEDTVEKGSLVLDWMDQEPLDLQTVDLVIMNPPFTRQESVGSFSDNYKDKLAARFNDYIDHVHGLMSFCSYFILLADKFLNHGGRMAMVIPSTILNKKSDGGIRQLLLDDYQIEYIVSRSDEPNFSEDTDLREVLLVARKTQNKGPTTYVTIDGLDHDFTSLPEKAGEPEPGETADINGIELQKVDVDQLNPNNLFGPLAVNNKELLKAWGEVTKSSKITALEDLGLGMIRGAQGGGHDARGYNPEMTLNAIDAYKMDDKDVWQVHDETPETITAKHRHTGDKFDIPRENVVKNTRRFSGRRTMDLSGLKEYAVVKRFDRFDTFESLTEQEDIPVEKWAQRVEDRLSHFALIRRGDMTAPGLSHTAFYSDDPCLWPNIMSLFPGADRETSKILAVWFDSTFGWLQFLIDRVETRGAYMAWRGFITDKFRTIDPSQLKDTERRTVLDTFDEVGSVESQSIVQQVAACTDEDQLSEEELQAVLDAFAGIDDHLFSGFEPRKSIDYTVLQVLDVPEVRWGPILDEVYPGLLLELTSLKQMMD